MPRPLFTNLTSPAIAELERQFGFADATNPPSLFDMIAPHQLRDPQFMEQFMVGLVTQATINKLKTEFGMEITQQVPEGEATHQPRPIKDVTIASPDMPTATNLATMTLRQV